MLKTQRSLFKEMKIDESDFYIMSPPVEFNVSMNDFMQAEYAAYDLPKG